MRRGADAATVRFEFAYEGGGMGKGGNGTLLINGEKVGQGRIEHTNGSVISADETADVGVDDSTPVDESYAGKSAFIGRIQKVTVEIE